MYGGEERCIEGFGGGGAEGRRPLGRPRCRWEENIKMDLQKVDWIKLAQDRDRWRDLWIF